MNPISASIALIHAGYVLAREGVFQSIPVNELPLPARLAHRVAGFVARNSSANIQQSERL